MSGCTSQSEDKKVNESKTVIKTPEKTAIESVRTGNQTAEKNTASQTGSRDSLDTKNYFNIRIVPASVLEQLQKEMTPEEILVHNDKGDAIGIVSSESLVIRGDLMQLERSTVNAGKDFDKTDIATHLLDITFGQDNVKIDLFKSNKDYKFWFDARYDKSDVDYVLKFAQKFNAISGTTQFEDEEVTLGFLEQKYEEIPNNYYNIKIVTQRMLDVKFDERKDSDHLIKDKDGKLIGIVNKDYLYLLDTLNEETRHYNILKGLMYSMGLHGTSFNDRESFFYREEGKNKELSDLDIESIKLLYGGGLKSGDTLEDARKSLGLSD
jgi:hypothetical protein